MALHILIPCKALAAGKSRLAPMLALEERVALCSRLLNRTLDTALAVAPAERCHLLSADRRAAAQAAELGIRCIWEHEDAGLNGALAAARDALCAANAGCELLVLPIDLPLATDASLRRLTAMRGEVIAAPDRHGIGTNALLLRGGAAASFAFRFGEASLAAHRRAAEERGFGFALCADPALAFDLDEPADLETWRASSAAPAPPRLSPSCP